MIHRSIIVLCCLTLLPIGRGFSQFLENTTVGAYGELHYNEPDGANRGRLDFHRFVIFIGHSFSERLTFMSELELEHTLIEAGEDEGGELAIEQAFLDYRLFDSFGFRAGILLPPVGIVNLYHEPPTFNGVERPSVDRVIIPTTWRESGAGVYGTILDQVDYQVYVVAGLDATGFSASNGLRGGRQNAFESNPANPSATGRLGYSPLPGFLLGGSFFIGSSKADHQEIGNPVVSLWSGDIRLNLNGFTGRAVGAIGSISETEKLNDEFGGNVADRIYGYYVEGGYNLLMILAPECDHVLDIFARYEKYNTQAATTGFSPLQQYNRNDVVLGLTYKPTYNTTFKFDYTFMNNALNNSAYPNTKQLNLGVGYNFN